MRNKYVAAILALLFGTFGVQRFYLGRYLSGLLYFLFCWTFIPMLLGYIDFIRYLVMDEHTFNIKYNASALLIQQGYGYAQPQIVIHNQIPHPNGIQHAQPAVSSADVINELEKLNELRISGALTEDEFKERKTLLLGQG